jgi:hypothetical protein
MACTAVLDEAIHQSAVKVGVGTPIYCTILRFQGTRETEKRLLLVGFLHLLSTHFLLLIGWSHYWPTCDIYMIPQLFKVWYVKFIGGEGNTFKF